MKILVEPLDVWLFRDGKPFAAGDDHGAVSFFPPTPFTLQGAVRTRILADQGIDPKLYRDDATLPIRKEIGSPEDGDFGTLRLRGPLLACAKGKGTTDTFFPAPQDLLVPAKERDGPGKLSAPLKDTLAESSLPWFSTWSGGSERVESSRDFLTQVELLKYLEGSVPEVSKSSDLFDRERRTGIDLDPATGTVKIGRLYSVEFIRVKGRVGILLDVTGTDRLSKSGLLQMGGESRAARYSEIAWDFPQPKSLLEKVQKTGRFKIYLAVPALFRQGWLPGWIDEKCGEGTIAGCKVRLVTAAIGRPQKIGGWNLAWDIPRPIRNAVPAGSVYFLEILEGRVETLFEALWWKSISDLYPEIGFGMSLIGGWDYVQ